jgi:hypothetical protein
MYRLDTSEAPTTPVAPTEFRPYEGDQPQRDGAVLMVEAYAAIWLILMTVVLLGHFKQRRLDARIGRLEMAMDRVIEERERET